MARFLWNPTFINFHELFDEGEERFPVECLPTYSLVEAELRSRT